MALGVHKVHTVILKNSFRLARAEPNYGTLQANTDRLRGHRSGPIWIIVSVGGYCKLAVVCRCVVCNRLSNRKAEKGSLADNRTSTRRLRNTLTFGLCSQLRHPSQSLAFSPFYPIPVSSAPACPVEPVWIRQ